MTNSLKLITYKIIIYKDSNVTKKEGWYINKPTFFNKFILFGERSSNLPFLHF